MIKLPFAFCEDKRANILISSNVNRLIAKMMEYQMNAAYPEGTVGYNSLLNVPDKLYFQTSRLFPDWVPPKEAARQFVLFYLLINSRYWYEMSLLQKHILKELITESVLLASTEGDDAFRCEFLPEDRINIGNALAEEFVRTVHSIHLAFQAKRYSDKYTHYNRIPYPAQKIADFENIYKLEEICFDDDIHTLLKNATPEEIAGILTEDSIFGPSFTLPEMCGTLDQDIGDVHGNPKGTAYTDPDCYLCYMDITQER